MRFRRSPKTSSYCLFWRCIRHVHSLDVLFWPYGPILDFDIGGGYRSIASTRFNEAKALTIYNVYGNRSWKSALITPNHTIPPPAPCPMLPAYIPVIYYIYFIFKPFANCIQFIFKRYCIIYYCYIFTLLKYIIYFYWEYNFTNLWIPATEITISSGFFEINGGKKW